MKLFSKLKPDDLITIEFQNNAISKYPFISGEIIKDNYVMLVDTLNGSKSYLSIPVSYYFKPQYIVPDNIEKVFMFKKKIKSIKV
jgi:hypothetical protein